MMDENQRQRTSFTRALQRIAELIKGFLPFTATLRSVVIKGAREVRLYVGKPEELKKIF